MPEAMNIAHRRHPENKFRELLDSIGNDKEIAALIEQHGYEAPPLASIRGWRSRNSVPSKWVPLLIWWAMKTDVVDDVRKLIKLARTP